MYSQEMKLVNKIKNIINPKPVKKYKKAIVTGGNGFIGSHIVDALVDNDAFDEIRIIDNNSAESHDKFYFNKSKKVMNFMFDIGEFHLIKPIFKDIDYVFHLAAESRIQIATQNPTLATKTNTTGTCNVLQAAKEAGCDRVIYSSTSSAYGKNNDISLKETMPNDCLNPYSVTKVAGEELCKMYTKLFGLKTIILRYFNVYGDRQPLKGQYAPVIGLFLKQKQQNQPMTIVGDGLQTRDFTNVEDVIEANLLAMNVEKGFGEIYNIGTGKSYSMLDLVRMIGGESKHIPKRIGESKHTRANNSKAKKVLGWSPKIKLKDYLK
jgi:UDP-glucose 4-epimerase